MESLDDMFSATTDLKPALWRFDVSQSADNCADDLTMEHLLRPEVATDRCRSRSNAETSIGIDETHSMEDNVGEAGAATETVMDWETLMFHVDTQRSQNDVIAVEDHESALCKVCGDRASGTYFGARVCVPCKTFFLRYGESNTFMCRRNKACVVSVETRTHCQHCRYQKCLEVGMVRKVRPLHVEHSDGQLICAVCGDVGNGIHFGVNTCEGCKKFFRRGQAEHATFTCKFGGNCDINPRTRNSCRRCRYHKCIDVGMSRGAIQMGRPSKVRVVSPPRSTPLDCRRQTLSRLPLSKSSASAIADSSSNDFGPETTTATKMTPSNSSSYSRVRTSNPAEGPVFRKDSGYVEDYDVQPDSTDTDNESSPSAERKPSLSINSPMTTLRDNDDEATDDVIGLSTNWMNTTYISGMLLSGPFDDTFQTVEGLPPPLSDDEITRLSHDAKPMSSGGGFAASSISSRSAVNLTRRPRVDNVGLVRTSGCAFEGDDEESASKRRRPDQPSMMTTNGHPQRRLMLPVTAASGDRKVRSGGVVSLSGNNDDEENVFRIDNDDVGLGSPSVTSSTRRFLLENNANSIADPGCDRGITFDVISGLVMSPASCRSNSDFEFSDMFNNRGSAAMAVGADQGRLSLDDMLKASVDYWLCPNLPRDNVLFAGDHWLIIKCIIPSYHRFVSRGKKLNDFLSVEYEKWKRVNSDLKLLPKWIESTVIPLYTLSSVKYCQSLPGFSQLALEDQATLIRLGQSSSRILVAAHQWFDAEQHRFRNFLPWRRDHERGSSDSVVSTTSAECDQFKQEVVRFCDSIQQLQLDSVEAGLLNVLLIFATDFPNLNGVALIERIRHKILLTFRAYTTAKYGSPNTRLEQIFNFVPSCRRLGLLHYLMTTTPTITMEEIGTTSGTPSTSTSL